METSFQEKYFLTITSSYRLMTPIHYWIISSASEGSFFPPRYVTKENLVNVYDKDLCRIMPLKYRKDVYKDG